MRTRKAAVFLLLICCIAAMGHARSYVLHKSGHNIGTFTNETRQEVDALILTFSGDVEIISILAIGGDMAITSNQGDFVILKGSLVSSGSILVEWTPLGEPALIAATWRTVPFALHQIDITSPFANMFVRGESEVREDDPDTHEYEFSALGSNDPDGEIVQYVWTWSDDAVAYGKNVTRNYGRWVEGDYTYTVTLTVIDAEGNSDFVKQVYRFTYIPVPPPS